MAKRISVVITCDVHSDGTPATDEAEFSHDGWTYTLDLCADHLAQFNETLGAFESAGTKSRSGGISRRARRPSSSATPNESTADREALRVWARANGYEVGDRGRIRTAIRYAYAAAQAAESEPEVTAPPEQAKVGQPRRSSAKAARAGKRPTNKAAASSAPNGIRSWALANGFQIGDRGPIPTNVREAYESAAAT